MELIKDAVKAASLARMQIELEYHLDSSDRLVPFPVSEEQARCVICFCRACSQPGCSNLCRSCSL